MKKIAFSALAISTFLAVTPVADAGALKILEDMERERATLLNTALDPDLTTVERQQWLDRTRRRLVDMERIVLRDDDLVGNTDKTVRHAFHNYDLTFLVHASAEYERHVTDHWLDQMGLSTATLRTTRMGRR